MLAGRGPRDPGPAARAQVESEGDAGQRAAAVDASEHVELAARDRRRSCGAAVRERREAAPAPVLEHEGGVERGAVAAVAADDVDASVGARRRRVVDRDGQVGQPPPAVVRDRVGVHARRVAAVRGEAAHRDDLPARDCLLRPRCAAPGAARGSAREPRRRQRRAPPRSARWGAIVAESLKRTSFDPEIALLASKHDSCAAARRAGARDAGLPRAAAGERRLPRPAGRVRRRGARPRRAHAARPRSLLRARPLRAAPGGRARADVEPRRPRDRPRPGGGGRGRPRPCVPARRRRLRAPAGRLRRAARAHPRRAAPHVAARGGGRRGRRA